MIIIARYFPNCVGKKKEQEICCILVISHFYRNCGNLIPLVAAVKFEV